MATRTFAEQNDSSTVPAWLLEAPMIDLKTLQNELNHVRAARLDAEAAEREVEELIWQVQHFEPGKQRMVFIFECGEPEMFGGQH